MTTWTSQRGKLQYGAYKPHKYGIQKYYLSKLSDVQKGDHWAGLVAFQTPKVRN